MNLDKVICGASAFKSLECLINLNASELSLWECFLGCSHGELSLRKHLRDLGDIIDTRLGELREKLSFSCEALSRCLKLLLLVSVGKKLLNVRVSNHKVELV